MKNGFTLVELSIVLVIIGLLIGGILVGQSLIESSKLNSFVRQIQQYDSAIMTFKDKYKGLPGESGLTTTVAGWGVSSVKKDGLLTDDDWQMNTTNYAAAGSEEYMLVWKELATLGYLKVPNCPNLATTAPAGNAPKTNGANCNMPLSSYGANKNIMIVAAAYTNPNFTTNFNKGNAYYTADCSAQVGSAWNCAAPFTQLEAMTYDAKVDDGKNNSGNVLGGTIFSGFRPVIQFNNISVPYDINSTTNMVLVQRFANGL